MKKSKKTKAPRRRTELDRIATQLRTMLRRDTVSVIEKGKLLLRSRELHANEHGDWMSWLEKNRKNFDMSYRSAINYCNAAEYVAGKSKFATVANFANVASTVLYRLADGGYTEQEEAEILAQAKAGKRIDQDAAWALCEKLAPADDDTDDGDAGAEPAAAEDPETTAILEGSPPAVPPPPPTPTPTDFALRDFDRAVGTLKRLMTKRAAQFAGSAHSGDDLENVASFIQAASDSKMAITAERAEPTLDSEPQTVAAAGTHSSRSRHANPRRIYVDFLKQMKPGDFRVELLLLSTAVASLERSCTISVSEEVSGDSC
jgi:hypothetical protein